MSSKVPILRQRAWISIIPHLAVMAALIISVHLIFRPTDSSRSLFAGALAYLLLSRLLRTTVASDHSRGVALLQTGAFDAAIPHFERSYAFFSRYPLLDRWRYLVLLSSSALSYREIALCNVAFAYGQLGDGTKSKDYYCRVLAEFPTSTLAHTALKMFDAAASSSTPSTTA